MTISYFDLDNMTFNHWDSWHCDLCNVDLKRTSKHSHLKSKSHLSKENYILPCDTQECGVCYEFGSVFKCDQCVNAWCATCHNRLDKCPFCRVNISKEIKLKVPVQKSRNQKGSWVIHPFQDPNNQRELQELEAWRALYR
jgi:hypothetical protein